MSVIQTVEIRFYICHKENAEKIYDFLFGLMEHYKKFFGEHNTYIGALPAKVDSFNYSSKEEFFSSYSNINCFKLNIGGYNAWNWDKNVTFFSPILDAGLCSNIAIIVWQDNDIDTIYINRSIEKAFYNWQKYEFNADEEGVYNYDFQEYLNNNTDEEDGETDEGALIDRFNEEYQNGDFNSYIERILDDPEEFPFEPIF